MKAFSNPTAPQSSVKATKFGVAAVSTSTGSQASSKKLSGMTSAASTQVPSSGSLNWSPWINPTSSIFIDSGSEATTSQPTATTNGSNFEKHEDLQSTKSEKINTVLAGLASIGYTGLTEEDLGKLNPPDEYETELQVMAEVRGYFQVSYKVCSSYQVQCVASGLLMICVILESH